MLLLAKGEIPESGQTKKKKKKKKQKNGGSTTSPLAEEVCGSVSTTTRSPRMAGLPCKEPSRVRLRALLPQSHRLVRSHSLWPPVSKTVPEALRERLRRHQLMSGAQCENSPPRDRLRVRQASHAASSTVERW